MSPPFSTLQLNVATWDLELDANGDIAIAAPPYAVAQDVSSAILTFQGEVYYDSTIGVPYEPNVLGNRPPIAIFENYMIAAALTVPSVQNAVCTIQTFQNRKVTGQIQFTDSSGTVQTVAI